MAYIQKVSVGSDWATQETINVRITIATSSSGVNVDKFVVQVKDQWGTVVFNSGEYYMRGGATHQFDIHCGRPAAGSRHERRLTVDCWSNYSTGYSGQGTGTLYGEIRPKPTITANNIALSTGTTTSRNITYNGLYLPGSERLSYQTYTDGFVQRTNGSTTGTFNLTGFPVNTSKDLAFGIVDKDSGGPYITNITKTVYPLYTPISKGTLSASRDSSDPTTINISWGAWTNFGNTSGLIAYAQIVDNNDSSKIKEQVINSKVAGSTKILGAPLDKSISIQIRVLGTYFDGVSIVETSNQVNLGYLNNTFIKVGGVWKRGIRTYIKVSGTWRANNGLVRRKENGGWK